MYIVFINLFLTSGVLQFSVCTLFKYIKITKEEHRLIRASVYSKWLPVKMNCVQFLGVFLLVCFAFASTNCV
jgi:hypothetical protein